MPIEKQEAEAVSREAMYLQRDVLEDREKIVVAVGPNTEKFKNKYRVNPNPIVFVSQERSLERAKTAEAVIFYFPGNAPEHPLAIQRVFQDYGPVFMAEHPTRMADYKVYGKQSELYYSFLANQTLDLIQEIISHNPRTKIVLAGTSLGGPALIQTALEASTHKLPINFGGLIFNATGIQSKDISPTLRKATKAASILLETFSPLWFLEEKVRRIILGATSAALVRRIIPADFSLLKRGVPPAFDKEIITTSELKETKREGRKRSLGVFLIRGRVLREFVMRPKIDDSIRLLKLKLGRTPVLIFEPERKSPPASLREPFLPAEELRLRDVLPRTGAAFIIFGGHAGTTYTRRVVHYARQFMEKQVLAEELGGR